MPKVDKVKKEIYYEGYIPLTDNFRYVIRHQRYKEKDGIIVTRQGRADKKDDFHLLWITLKILYLK